MFIVYWFFHRCSHSTLDKTVLDWCYIIQKIKQAKEPQLYFSLLKFNKFHTWENIFMLFTRGGLEIQRIQTWWRNHKGMQNHVISKKQNKQKKWRVVVLRILRRFCGCFGKAFNGKYTHSLQLIWPLKYGTFYRLSSS